MRWIKNQQKSAGTVFALSESYTLYPSPTFRWVRQYSSEEPTCQAKPWPLVTVPPLQTSQSQLSPDHDHQSFVLLIHKTQHVLNRGKESGGSWSQRLLLKWEDDTSQAASRYISSYFCVAWGWFLSGGDWVSCLVYFWVVFVSCVVCFLFDFLELVLFWFARFRCRGCALGMGVQRPVWSWEDGLECLSWGWVIATILKISVLEFNPTSVEIYQYYSGQLSC